MPTARRARIFTRWRLVFPKLPNNCQVFCQTIGGVFLTFLSKIKDGNSICQTAGDALTRMGSNFQMVASTVVLGMYALQSNYSSSPDIFPKLSNYVVGIACKLFGLGRNLVTTKEHALLILKLNYPRFSPY